METDWKVGGQLVSSHLEPRMGVTSRPSHLTLCVTELERTPPARHGNLSGQRAGIWRWLPALPFARLGQLHDTVIIIKGNWGLLHGWIPLRVRQRLELKASCQVLLFVFQDFAVDLSGEHRSHTTSSRTGSAPTVFSSYCCTEMAC